MAIASFVLTKTIHINLQAPASGCRVSHTMRRADAVRFAPALLKTYNHSDCRFFFYFQLFEPVFTLALFFTKTDIFYPSFNLPKG